MTLFFSTFVPGRFRNTYPPIDRQYFPYQYAGRTYLLPNERRCMVMLASLYIFTFIRSLRLFRRLPSFVVYLRTFVYVDYVYKYPVHTFV